MKKLFALFAATFIAGSAFAGEFPDISIADLKKAIADKKVTVVDVMGTSSYKDKHVPGAIDFAAVKADLAKALPADKGALVIAYCGGPSCGAYAAAAKAASPASPASPANVSRRCITQGKNYMATRQMGQVRSPLKTASKQRAHMRSEWRHGFHDSSGTPSSRHTQHSSAAASARRLPGCASACGACGASASTW